MHIWEFEIEIFINIMMKQYTNVTEKKLQYFKFCLKYFKVVLKGMESMFSSICA